MNPLPVTMMRYSREQGLMPRKPAIEGLFAPSTCPYGCILHAAPISR